MRVRSLILAVVLAALAVKAAEFTVTRDGVGAVEYLTMAALIALLVQNSFRLTRRALRRS